MPNRGEELARRKLIHDARSLRQTGTATLPSIATVASVEGDTVTVRVSGSDDADVEQIGFLSATVAVGDRGILLPIKDGGRVFARSGSALTADDLPVLPLPADPPATPTKTLAEKLAEIAAREQAIEDLQGQQDQAIVALDNDVIGLENTKRNTADPIPQADVDGLGTTLSSIARRFVYDSFTAANGTVLTGRAGETGATWTSDGGAFAIHNGRIYGTATGFLYASGIPPTADYSVEAEFTHFNSTGENAIALRVQPGANTGYYLYYNFGSFRLFSRVGGVVTSLGSVVWSTANMPVVAGITATGSSIQIVINGIVRATYTSTAITAAGRAGLYLIPIATNTGQHLDRFAAKAPMAQTDVVDLVSNLANKLEPGTSQNNIDGLVTALAGKLVPGTAQSNISGLVTSLAGKLVPGTSQSNIANLVPNLADKAATAYVNSEIRLKTPSARVLGSNDSTSSTGASGIGTVGVAAEYMIFYVGAFQEWRVNAYLECNTSHVGGGNMFDGAYFGIAIPTGATLIGTVIGPAFGNEYFPYRWTISGLNPIVYLQNKTSGRVEIQATVKTGSTTGFCVVQKAAGNSNDTLTVLTGSWADAQRIINTD